jgi:hypothetical protein
VKAQWNDCYVRVLDPKTGQLLREHTCRKQGQHAIPECDRPKRMLPHTEQLLARAAKIGRHIGVLCQTLYERDGLLSIRRIQGVLALAKKHGIAETDAACATALEFGVPHLRFVRRYLEHKPQLPLSLRQVDPLIRELTHYRELIEQRTKENTEHEHD